MKLARISGFVKRATNQVHRATIVSHRLFNTLAGATRRISVDYWKIFSETGFAMPLHCSTPQHQAGNDQLL